MMLGTFENSGCRLLSGNQRRRNMRTYESYHETKLEAAINSPLTKPLHVKLTKPRSVVNKEASYVFWVIQIVVLWFVTVYNHNCISLWDEIEYHVPEKVCFPAYFSYPAKPGSSPVPPPPPPRVKVWMTTFFAICLLVGLLPCTFQIWSWKQHIYPKWRYPPIRLHGIITQKTEMWRRCTRVCVVSIANRGTVSLWYTG
jgi:hypothetical protein